MNTAEFQQHIYKYNSRKALVFFSDQGVGITEPCYPYLSCCPENYYIFHVFPYVCIHLPGRYFNTFNSIDNHNRMRKSDLSLDKYCMTQSGYFKLAITLSLGMSITDVNIVLFNGM